MSQITANDLLNLFTPETQKQITELFATAKRERGAAWLEEIKTEYPLLSWAIDLCCNKTFDEAFDELKKSYPPFLLLPFKNKLQEFHSFIKTEVERKR